MPFERSHPILDGMTPSLHPCQSCGACCAFYRVSFYWREAEAAENPLAVPVELTEDYSSTHRAMRGTNRKHHARCVALEGKIGERVACQIYSLRPSPCREFTASYEDGQHQPRCDESRARYGMPPLRRKDWLSAFPQSTLPATLDSHEPEKSM